MTLDAAIAPVDELSELEEDGQVVLVDRHRVAPEDAARFADAWSQDVERLRRRPGFVSAQLRAADGAYVSVVVWRSARALRASLELPARPAQAPVTAAIGRFGTVEVDVPAREVRKDGTPVPLTLKELDLLLTLMSQPRRVFTREELMDRVWGYRAALETGTLSVHMRRLRKKLEADPASPRHFETVWGVGYRFVP
jgi:DNA-binding response OmpR family regulator